MKAHKINEGGKMFKKEDFVRFRGRLGIVKEVKLVNAIYVKYTLYKVEFEDSITEWVNSMYLVKA